MSIYIYHYKKICLHLRTLTLGSVVPPDPSAQVEDQPKEQSLLERAADTVFNLVKKFTGNGHDNKEDKQGDDSKLGTQDNKMTAPEKESQGESKGHNCHSC